ncbi:MAG TPA: FAD-binding oxidoreductase [Chitinophagales bacterium]|nr:FAD-binding oxidoreductase [Chitinophagales bacterium]
MAQHVVKILDAEFITHDVKRFAVEKPKGFTFVPGQAADVSINLPGWEDKLRPFTFTGLNKWDYLEFIIKIYTHHEGVTHQLSRVNAGGELILHDVFGAIQYKGPGVFIAGGAGITPFIAILRELYRTHQIKENRLIYSNKTAADIILGPELQQMLQENFINHFSRQNNIGFLSRHINRDYLIENIVNFSQYFYLCGPDKFVADINTALLDLGAVPELVVFEQ